MKKILIIEDEEAMLDILADVFAMEGFITFKAKNGEDGLALALKERPDLILLDIIMPKMDGMTMLKKLREDQWGKTASVIVLTNLSDEKMLDGFVEKGAYDYLIKTNWNLAELTKKIKEKLSV